MSQLNNPYIFTATDSVTATKLNNMISQTSIGPEAISTQNEKTTPVSTDVLLGLDGTTSQLIKIKAGNLNLGGVIASSISGPDNSDITITPKDAAIVTTKNYTSADGINNTVTSSTHGLSVGQVLTVSSASNSLYNGTYRITQVPTADTFTYSIPSINGFGTFACSNGVLVTVTSNVHGLTTGQIATVTSSNSAFNGSFTITVTGTNTFTYSLVSTYGSGSGNITSSNNVLLTVTTASAHNLVTNDRLTLTSSISALSGTYNINVLTPTTFTYSLSSIYGSGSGTFSSSGTTVTITSTTHGLVTGQSLAIVTSNTGINGTFTITVTGTNTFTYVSGSSSTSTGTVSYSLSSAISATASYVLNSTSGSSSYISSIASGSGSLSYTKQGVIKNPEHQVINGNLYVDGNSVIKGNTTQTGNVINNGTVTIVGNLNLSQNLNANLSATSTAVTQSSSDSSTKIATTAFVNSLSPIKAWVNFNGNGSTVGANLTVNSSFNVTNVVYEGTGLYTINFTNAISDANYAIIGMANAGGSNGSPTLGLACTQVANAPILKSTTQARIVSAKDSTGIATNQSNISVMIIR